MRALTCRDDPYLNYDGQLTPRFLDVMDALA
jgi:hypothetical protein